MQVVVVGCTINLNAFMRSACATSYRMGKWSVSGMCAPRAHNHRTSYRMTVGTAYCRHNTPQLNRFHNSKLNEHGTVCQLRKCTMQCCHCTSISSTPIPRILLGRNSTQNVTLHRETRKVNCRHSGVCSDANLNSNTLQHT